MISKHWEELIQDRKDLLFVCVRHGMSWNDAERELDALISRNLGAYTHRIRTILHAEGMWEES